jgi:hypothetical protein
VTYLAKAALTFILHLRCAFLRSGITMVQILGMRHEYCIIILLRIEAARYGFCNLKLCLVRSKAVADKADMHAKKNLPNPSKDAIVS